MIYFNSLSKLQQYIIMVLLKLIVAIYQFKFTTFTIMTYFPILFYLLKID